MLPNAITDSEPDDFPIKDWPVQTEAARQGLSGMLTTHRVNPLPAYDHKGNLIQPTEYRAKLMGAIVRATITLKHWNITANLKGDEPNSRDTYTADIENLRILVPAPKPATPTTTPRKRRNLEKTDPGSPTKKGRFV